MKSPWTAIVPRAVQRWWPVGAALLAAGLHLPSAVLVNLGRLSYSRAVVQASIPVASDYEQARSRARQAIFFNPRDSRAYLLAGLTDLAQGNKDAAVLQLSRAAQLDPTDILAHAKLAEVYYGQGEQQLAVRHWSAARAAPRFMRQGVDAYTTRSNWTEALENFKIATRIAPEEFDAWLELGNAYKALNKPEDARKSFEEAIRRHPRKSGGYARLAYLYFGLKQPELASSVIAEGFANVRPPSADLYYIRSRLAAERFDYPAAEHDAHEAINLDPRNSAYPFWLGDLYFRQKLNERAVAQYTQTGVNFPSWVWISEERIGNVRAAEQNWDAAIAAYDAAVTAGLVQKLPPPILAQNYVALGEALRSAGRIEFARSAFQKALNHDPANQAAARRLATLQSQ